MKTIKITDEAYSALMDVVPMGGSTSLTIIDLVNFFYDYMREHP